MIDLCGILFDVPNSCVYPIISNVSHVKHGMKGRISLRDL